MSTTPRKSSKGRRWSADVTKHSDALDLKSDVFKGKDPHRIALSLKRSAERSKRRKGTPYQSAMSMLNFYVNRAGKNLPQKQKHILGTSKGRIAKGFRPRLGTVIPVRRKTPEVFVVDAGKPKTDARTRSHSESYREKERACFVDFARSAFGVRCVLASF